MTLALETFRQIVPGVHELRLPIPFEDGRVNCFLFTAGRDVDLIDCGMNSPESLELIRAAVREVGGPSGRLRRLVVTHIHPDHYGAAGVLTRDDGAELYLHRLEVPLVHPRYLDLEQLVAEVGRYLEIHGVPEPEAEEMRNASRFLRDFVTPGGVAVTLDGSETIELGERRLRVEWTPGHSPGHICLFEPGDGLLFAGDQLLPEISSNIGLHPQSTPNPLDEFIEGQHRLLALRPKLVLPSHGRPFEDAERRVRELEAHHDRRKAKILAMLEERDELSGFQVAIGLHGRRSELWEKRLSLQEALAHLQSLSVAARIEKVVSSRAVRWRRLSRS